MEKKKHLWIVKLYSSDDSYCDVFPVLSSKRPSIQDEKVLAELVRLGYAPDEGETAGVQGQWEISDIIEL